MAVEKFPKILFIKKIIVGDFEDLEASEKKEELSESFNDLTEVGEYHLVRTFKLKSTLNEIKS